MELQEDNLPDAEDMAYLAQNIITLEHSQCDLGNLPGFTYTPRII